MQARYYDPVIGRFYSNDPVGFTGEIDTFNRYSYVANNPYKYTDPNGEEKHTVQVNAAFSKLFGGGLTVSFSYDTTHNEITFDRSIALKSGSAGKGSIGYTVTESPEKAVGNSSSSTLTANLNHNAEIQLGDTKLGGGGSTNLLGVKFSDAGVENISGNPNAASGGMSTTGEGAKKHGVIGGGVDISAEVKYSKSSTINIKETIQDIKEIFK